MGIKKTFLVCTLVCVSFLGMAQNPGDTLFKSSFIHNINITFTQSNFWDSLMYYKQHSDSFNLSTQNMSGNVIIDGVQINTVGVKLKGNSSFGYPGQKKSIKLSFNQYVPGQKLEGLTVLDLNNNTLDPTMMREKLLLDFMNKKGLAAPRCIYARVSYNGQYVGLYKMIEEVDKEFISTRFANWGGNLFKGDPKGTLMWGGNNPATYYPWYELHSNNSINNWGDLVNFIDNVNNTPSATFYDTLETQLSTTSFIGQWAARNLFVDLDAYFHAPHNYYLYHNTVTQRFEWATWDVSVAFGFYPYWSEDSTEHTSLLMSTFPLTTKMLANTTYKTTYLNTVCDYLDYFSNSVMTSLIDSIGNRIRADIYAEPDSNQMFPEFCFEFGMDTFTLHTPIGDIPGLKKFITNRRANVLAELNSLGWACPLVGVNELKSNSNIISIFPNPSSGKFNLRSDTEVLSVEVLNSLGQTIYYEKIHSPGAEIDLSTFTKGVYFIRLYGKTYCETKKLILE